METPLRNCAALLMLAAGCALCAGSEAPPDRLQEIARHLAERHDARVIVDPAITLAAPPPAPDDALPIDQALDAIARSVPSVMWRRIYLPEYQSRGTLPVEALATAARTLGSLATESLAVENAASRQVTLFLKEPLERGAPAPGSAGVPSPAPSSRVPAVPRLGPVAAWEPWVGRPTRRRSQERLFDARPVYLLYRTAAADDDRKPESRLADLQRQQLAIPVPEEQQGLAMVLTLQLIQGLEPAKAEQLMRRTAEAAMRLWDSTPPGERGELMRHSFQVMRRFAGFPQEAPVAQGAGASPVGRPPAAPRQPAREDHSGELKTLAAALSARYDAPFRVDPALFLALSPPAPAADLPVEKAMETITAPLSGIAWRRVYLTDGQRDRIDGASEVEKLAAAVRTLERLESGDLVLEEPAARRAITHLKNHPRSASFDRELSRWKLNRKPVYLFYSTTPAAQGGTLTERSASLQRQQMDLMLRMDTEQMEQSMEQVLQLFRSADTAGRTRLLGLPVMAGMMAVWFPRAALEGQSPGDSDERSSP
jgi:hypothetical protein